MTSTNKHTTEFAIIALLNGNLSNPEREELIAHLNDCSECRADFTDIVSLQSSVEDSSLAENVKEVEADFIKQAKAMHRTSSKSTGIFQVIPYWAWTAAAMLIFAVLFWYPSKEIDEVQFYRNDASGQIIQLHFPTDGYTSDTQEVQFIWEVFSERRVYKILIYSTEGFLLHETLVTNANAKFDGEVHFTTNDSTQDGDTVFSQSNKFQNLVLMQFTPEFVFEKGSHYLWKITTSLEDGRSYESELRALQINQ